MKNTFSDNVGREWTINVSFELARKINQQFGVKLLQVSEALFEKLADPLEFIAIVYELCKFQADKIGLSQEQFMEGMLGDPQETAVEAVVEGIARVVGTKQGANLRRAYVQSQELRASLMDAAQKTLDKIDDDLSKGINPMAGDLVKGIGPAEGSASSV